MQRRLFLITIDNIEASDRRLSPCRWDTLTSHGFRRWGNDLDKLTLPSNFSTIDWVIIGAESGPGARRCRIQWIRDLVHQCDEAGVPVFVKQIHLDDDPRRLSRDVNEWPVDLRRQEYPRQEEER